MKKLEIVLIAVAALLLLLGCVFIATHINIKHPETNIDQADSITEAESTLVPPPIPEELPVDDEPANADDHITDEEEPEEADVPASDPDPYGMYKVPEEWATVQGGIFVKRDTGLYTISNLVPRNVAEEYDVGFSIGNTDTEFLYLTDDRYVGVSKTIPTLYRHAILSVGDFPILQVSKKNDELVMYYNVLFSNSDSIFLTKTDWIGYTIPACDRGEIPYFPIIDHEFSNRGVKKRMAVLDMDENPVSDVRDLEYGKKYIFEWYEGTDYHSVELAADSRCYDYDPENKKIKLEATPTKSGYYTYDISDLEPGLYLYIDSVFELVE